MALSRPVNPDARVTAFRVRQSERPGMFAWMAGMALLIALFLSGGARPVGAAELLMLEQAGCSWCLRFDREIAHIYPKTEQGGIAPLRRVDINEEWPADLEGVAIERFTPTFVLMHDGVEYGRLRGYSGDEFFWYLLDDMITRLPPDALKPAVQTNSTTSG